METTKATKTPKKMRWRIELEVLSKKAFIWYWMSMNIAAENKVDLGGSSRTSYVISHHHQDLVLGTFASYGALKIQ
jgi:hypothetical protein